jgi:hypothetical protein
LNLCRDAEGEEIELLFERESIRRVEDMIKMLTPEMRVRTFGRQEDVWESKTMCEV